jgi:hypothetical protein
MTSPSPSAGAAPEPPEPAPPAARPSLAARFFAGVLANRWLVLAIYAVLLPPAAWYAAKVGQDNSIDRLIVPTDLEAKENREFAKVFGGGEYAVLIAEAPDPFAPAVLARVDRLETALAKVPGLSPSSALSIYRRAKAGFAPTPEQIAGFKAFALGSRLLAKQGLVGPDFLSIALVMDIQGREARAAALASVERAIADAGGGGPPLTALRRVGQPYITVLLDEATQRAGTRGFLLFMVLVVALNLGLYRSGRALVAFLVTLGVVMALSVGYVGATGGTFTIVSPMVPMTILITATATLVYLHSRFVDRPPGRPLAEHHVFALTNKLVACTASIFATAVGFAALSVSRIRPIREMGLWVAVGLVLTWITVFTLFPALQSVLRTPTSTERRLAVPWFERFSAWLPGATYRARYALVFGALALCAVGVVSLRGLPGVLPPMRLGTHPLEYIDARSAVYQDTRWAERKLPGNSIAEIWIKGGLGAISEPEVLTGLHRFQQALEKEPEVGAAIGPTTILRMTRYIAGQGDGWPADAEGVDQLAGDLEGLVPTEPMLQRFVQRHGLGQTHVTLLTGAHEHADFERVRAAVTRCWDGAVAASPALAPLTIEMVGLAPLQARFSQSLVPTLVESFALTAGIIFITFLVVFRSGPARIMTMIPSVFAILAMFAFMRLTGIPLNIATILIASTVLGTSENDQIHFFYHFLEKRKDGTVEEALRHTLSVSGRAILFATLINAGGFLAFVAGDLPPIRQFGLLTALALTASMIADFSALPAALWIVFRAKPDAAPAREERPAGGT